MRQEMNRRHEETRRLIFDNTRRRLEDRLKRVCGDLSSAEFDRLLDRMTTIEIKYSVRRRANHFPPRNGGGSGGGTLGNERGGGSRSEERSHRQAIETNWRGNLHML